MRILFFLFCTCLSLSLFSQGKTIDIILKNADSVILVSHEMTSSSTNIIIDSLGNKINLESIITKGKLNEQITKEKLVLSEQQVFALSNILSKRYKPSRIISMSQCFDPHHSVIIYKKAKISYIDLCFGCQDFETSRDIQGLEIKEDKWEELYLLFKKYGFKYEMGLDPVLDYRSSSYSISYPENWKIDTSKILGIDLFIFSPPDSAIDKFRENINVLSGQIGEGTSLDSFFKTSELSIKTMATDLVILESRKISTHAKAFYKIDFTATQGIFKLRFIQYYFVSNGKGYTITATVERDKFNSYEENIMAILNSFSLN